MENVENVFDNALKLKAQEKIICNVCEDDIRAFELLSEQEENLQNTIASAISDTRGLFSWEDYAKAQYLVEKKRFEKQKKLIEIFESIVGAGNTDVLCTQGIMMRLNVQAMAVEIFNTASNGECCEC